MALTNSSLTSTAICASAFASSVVAEVSCCWALVSPSRHAWNFFSEYLNADIVQELINNKTHYFNIQL